MILVLDFIGEKKINGKRIRKQSLVRCDRCLRIRVIEKPLAVRLNQHHYCRGCWNTMLCTGKHPSLETRKKMGNSRRGKKHSEEAKIKIGNSHRGKFISEDTKKKICENHWATGGPLTEQVKQRLRDVNINHPVKKFTNTSIEIIVADQLKNRNIPFQQNVGVDRKANVDFLLPDRKMVIECDGCYYHCCSECGFDNWNGKREKDERKTKLLTESGYKVIRFWEHEILKFSDNPQLFWDKLGIEFNNSVSV
jgi:DNA mismatch endonuclease (patch repair protein)